MWMALYKKKQSYFFLIANLLERACNVVNRHLFKTILLGFSKRHQLACTLGNCARQRVGAILVWDISLSITTTIIPYTALWLTPLKLLKILSEKQIIAAQSTPYAVILSQLYCVQYIALVASCTRHTPPPPTGTSSNECNHCTLNNNLELIIHTYRHMYIELSSIVKRFMYIHWLQWTGEFINHTAQPTAFFCKPTTRIHTWVYMYTCVCLWMLVDMRSLPPTNFWCALWLDFVVMLSFFLLPIMLDMSLVCECVQQNQQQPHSLPLPHSIHHLCACIYSARRSPCAMDFFDTFIFECVCVCARGQICSCIDEYTYIHI